MVFIVLLLSHYPAAASDLSTNWGGHLRLRGSVSFPENNSVLEILDRDRLHDGAFEFRSKHTIDWADIGEFDLHYEAVGSAGETLKANAALVDRYPAAGEFYEASATSDDRRLMDLTHVITDHSDYRIYHRLDRLSLTVRRGWGSVRIGRQALTWGNGFLFNPMDLFNPFSPTDVERDYKIGDDMVTIQGFTGTLGEVQLLYVPRRDPATGDIEWEKSSLAGKVHSYAGSLEIDVMAGIHYDDGVAGIGLTGYAGSAAWRLDATYTWLSDDSRRNGYASIAANMDYSWVWLGRNMYGWIECYYTGLGTTDYEDLWSDSDILERIDRRERFTIGRAYIDANLQMELHPLLNCHLTLINNVRDPSGVVQPRLVWDPAQNVQVTAGTNLYYGASNTEFGGFDLAPLPFKQAPANGVYAWLSFFY